MASRRLKSWERYAGERPQDDEFAGGYTREGLEAMDRRFIERVERAIANGQEPPQADAPMWTRQRRSRS